MNNVLCRFYLHCNARLAIAFSEKLAFMSWGNIKCFNYKPCLYAPLYKAPSHIRGCLISGVLRYISGCNSAYLLLPKKKSIYFRRQINQTLSFFEFSKVMC